MPKSALPAYLRLWWFCASPLGVVLAVRIVWERVVLTRAGNAELVGFSVIHLYPTFGIIGLLCCFSLMIWLLQAVSCMASHWQAISMSDVLMILTAILVGAAVVAPERFLS
jgi:hypothetical protein